MYGHKINILLLLKDKVTPKKEHLIYALFERNFCGRAGTPGAETSVSGKAKCLLAVT